MRPVNIDILVRAQIPVRGLKCVLMLVAERNARDSQHPVLIIGQPNVNEEVFLRIHSECFTGDVLTSQRCDCGDQLSQSLDLMLGIEKGILIYLRQEGRGIGLLEKLKAYNLQERGLDTVDANLALGHNVDSRTYGVAAAVLRELGIDSVRLLTNNPEKVVGLQRAGIVTVREPLRGAKTPHNHQYLRTKAERLGHLA